MKKYKCVLALLLAAILGITVIPVNTYAADTDETTYKLTYEIENGSAVITGYKGTPSGDLIIPEEIDGYKVTKIGKEAFWDCDKFTGNLKLPSGLIRIEERAFKGCHGLTGNLIFPSGLTNIESNAFMGCSGFVGNLKFPPKLTEIGAYAFWGCSGFTGNLELPAGLINIKRSAFANCSGFTGSLTFSDGLKSIEREAFANCNGFTGSLELPAGILSIEQEAFRKCTGFTGNLKLPAELTRIGMYAFAECSGFTGNLALPPKLEVIDVCAFKGCKGFTDIRFAGDTPSMNSDVFQSITANAYYPIDANKWDNFLWYDGRPISNLGGTLTWFPYKQGSEPWLPEATLTGTLDAVDALGFRATIDGIAYDVTDDFEMNTAMELYTSDDKRVACILQYGKISQMVPITDILVPRLRLSVIGGGLVYQDEKFSETQRQLAVSVICSVKSPYTASDLEKFPDLSVSCEKFKLSIADDDTLNFGKEGTIFKKSITEIEQKVDASLALGDIKSYQFELNLEDHFIPKQITTEIPITGELVVNGHSHPGSCKVSIVNADLQAQKAAEKKEQQELAQKVKSAKESLGNLNLALGPTLDYYFNKAQVEEIKTYLNIWLAEVISSTSITYTKQDKKIQDYVFKKLGINNNAITFVRSTKAVTTITGMTEKYGEINFEFKVDIDSYILGDGNPYVSDGYITYELKDKKNIPSNIPSSGEGKVVFANMKTFAEKLRDVAESSVKVAYQDTWGKHANEVADIIVNKTIMDLINQKYGSFSDGVYTLFTKPVKSFVKKVYVECPVDVYIYDLSGNLCGSIVNNEVDTSNTDIYMYVEEDRKCVYLCGDDYKIKLVGNDEGTMTYRIEECVENTSCLRTVEFKQVPLTKGKTYTGFVMEPLYIDNSLYALTSDNDEVIRPDTDTYQDTRISRIYVDGIAMNTSSLKLKVGEAASLNASLTPANATNQQILWSSNNENIVSVDENGNVSAKEAGTAKITAVSDDGGFEAYCTVSVWTSDNHHPPVSDDENQSDNNQDNTADTQKPSDSAEGNNGNSSETDGNGSGNWNTEENNEQTGAISGVLDGTGNTTDSATYGKRQITATPTAYNTIMLSWNSVPGAKSYEIFYSTSPDGGFKRLANAKKTSYKFSKAKCGVTYYFQMRVCEKKVKSEFGPVSYARTALTGSTTLQVKKTTYNSVQLKWNKIPGAKKYEIFYTDSIGGTWQSLGIKSGTSFTHKKLVTGATYYYQVRPVRDSFHGNWSNGVSATTTLGDVVGLKVKAAGSDRMKLSWKKVNGATQYVILRSESIDGTYETIGRSGKASYMDTGLPGGTTYFYKVYAVSGPYKTKETAPVGQTTKIVKK